MLLTEKVGQTGKVWRFGIMAVQWWITKAYENVPQSHVLGAYLSGTNFCLNTYTHLQYSFTAMLYVFSFLWTRKGFILYLNVLNASTSVTLVLVVVVGRFHSGSPESFMVCMYLYLIQGTEQNYRISDTECYTR